jgi:hypothetical protein
LATKGGASQILQINAMSASGEVVNFDLRGEFLPLRPLLEELKRTREAGGPTCCVGSFSRCVRCSRS